MLLVIIVGLFLSWGWLVDSSKWDLYLMESSSGRIQWEVELVGEKFRAPFIIGYGMAQPVLPAAIVYPGIPITRAISIFRALGMVSACSADAFRLPADVEKPNQRE